VLETGYHFERDEETHLSGRIDFHSIVTRRESNSRFDCFLYNGFLLWLSDEVIVVVGEIGSTLYREHFVS